MTDFADKRHFPEEKQGCYYRRPQSCCALCYLRMVVGAT